MSSYQPPKYLVPSIKEELEPVPKKLTEKEKEFKMKEKQLKSLKYVIV
jgi:hypothetical protein